MRELSSASGAPVQRVAFGAEQLGGYEWGSVDVAGIERAATHAAGNGGVFFDTADCYGKGDSERRLGAALAPARAKAFIATKFGVRFDPQGRVYYDNAPDYAEAALDASLGRLGTDYVDLLQVHWPDGHTPLPRLFERLERLRDDGRIRWYGVTNFPYPQLGKLPGEWPGFATFSGQFSLVQRADEAAINLLCRRKGLVFLSWGSLAQGLLSGKYGRGTKFGPDDRRVRPIYDNFHGERFARNLAVVDRLTAIAARTDGLSPSQLAIRFVLEAVPRSIAIVGVKSRQQFDQNMKALALALAPETLRELREASAATTSDVSPGPWV